MSGLFSQLQSTARSLNAQQLGLETVGQNVANLNTEGYTRRGIDFAEVPPTDRYSAGSGVTVLGIHSSRDRFTEQRMWGENHRQQEQNAIADFLSVAQGVVGLPGQSIDADLSAFFDAWAELADDPTSGTARRGVVEQAQAVADSFARTSEQMEAIQHDADLRVRSTVASVNSYAAQIATFNIAIIDAGGIGTPQGLAIADELHEAVNKLSQLIDINVNERPDGQLDVSYVGGRALVIGGNHYDLSVGSAGPSGLAIVRDVTGADITSQMTTGRIGGLLNVRDTLLPSYLSQLDTIAYTLVQQANTLHAAGFDLSGAAGGNFFTPLASSAGAASQVSIVAGVASNPSTIAAAGTAAPGDNQNARDIAALRNARVLGGGSSTLTDGWGSFVYAVGQDAQLAERGQKTHAAILTQIEALRDAASGVSIDEEATMMLKFQRAYEANARYFQTVNGTIDTLFSILNRIG